MARSLFHDLVSKVAAKYGIAGELEAAHVRFAYNNLVEEMCGKQLVGKTSAKYLKKRELWVKVYGSAAAQSLQLKKHLILEKLQEKFGSDRIASLRIVQD